MIAPSMEELSAALASARADLDGWIANTDADRDIDPDTAVAALRVELLARGYGVAYLSALAAWAVGRLAEARRHPLDLGGRRHLTREVVEDIADDMRHVRAEDVCDG